MEKISESVIKKDHSAKIKGEALYVGDYDNSDILFGKMLRSKKAKARLVNVKLPLLPHGYYYVDKTDIPGDNNVNIVMDDTPVYARETVEYIGEPIGMVCGPDSTEVERIISEIEVE